MAGSPPPFVKPAVKLKTFNCPQCGGPVLIRAQGLTTSVVCSACGSIIDAVNNNFRVIDQVNKKLVFKPIIPLGARGQLNGVLWEMIGFMVRRDVASGFTWGEYLLFNPHHGFRWLTESQGHWSFISKLYEEPTPDFTIGNRKYTKVLGRQYWLFHKGIAKVHFVLGEFYWRVKVGDAVAVEDYICPPEQLSYEATSETEIQFSLGEYLDSNLVRTAFDIRGKFPEPSGVAPNQPSKVGPSLKSALKQWLLFGLIAFAIQSGDVIFSSKEVVSQMDLSYVPRDPQKQKVSVPFDLRHGISNVEFELSASVNNDWLEGEYDLVNEQTGETFELSQAVEFYSGHDGGEYWSEGSKTSRSTLPTVPAGTYHLNYQFTGPEDALTVPSWAAAPTSAAKPLNLKITRGVSTVGNFLLVLLLISIYPIILLLRNRTFEFMRWSESHFSPYGEGWQGDDD